MHSNGKRWEHEFHTIVNMLSDKAISQRRNSVNWCSALAQRYNLRAANYPGDEQVLLITTSWEVPLTLCCYALSDQTINRPLRPLYCLLWCWGSCVEDYKNEAVTMRMRRRIKQNEFTMNDCSTKGLTLVHIVIAVVCFFTHSNSPRNVKGTL